MNVPVVVISGSVGVGKTTAAHQLGLMLEDAGVPHSAVDIDGLAMTFPRPTHDPFGVQLSMNCLRAIWPLLHAAGSRHLVVPWLVESEHQLDGIRAAVPGADVTLVTLLASLAVINERLAMRESGSELHWHLERARVLASRPDPEMSCQQLRINTDARNPSEIAADILRAIGWR